MNYLFPIILAFLSHHTLGATIDLSQDNNKNGPNVETLVLGGAPTEKIQLIGIEDSTGYGEVYVGTSCKLGGVTLSPYIGAEWTKDLSPKERGMFITSYSLGSFKLTSLVEFAGRTGNFNKTSLSYTAGAATISVLRHSVAGSGVRIDYATSHFSPYLQVLERRTTVGVALKF